jgi:hypothetical protein
VLLYRERLLITALLECLGDLTTRIAKMAKTGVRILFNFTAAIGSTFGSMT